MERWEERNEGGMIRGTRRQRREEWEEMRERDGECKTLVRHKKDERR